MSARSCSRCGVALPSAGGLTGICPACAFLFAIGSLGDETGTVPGSPPLSAHRIGPYLLIERIGEGGMGEVWLAEQTEPVRRRVALKLIKPGMDSKQIIARFEAERQALALMDHPCVSKVLGAGTTDQGRPYFVMEHVSGLSITEHCDRYRLTTMERIELFLRVCDGVQHAHQRAIIHRDLKPSNVLVALQDGVPMPKIIDFGVAKAMAQPLTDKSLYTEVGSVIGTPEYMSPEQVDLKSQDVDTRSDVYALGVMLYELLSGALPFESDSLRRAGFEEARRIIREVEPPRPSLRLSTREDARSVETAKQRRTEPVALRRQLSGELDWITMKALEKERGRRYGSPAEFAADLRRHLRNEPVAAGPPSVRYRARKFVRRHRFGVAAALVALVGLVGFAAAMAVQARRIEAERKAAERVSGFLENMLNKAEPGEMGATLLKELRERVAEAQRARGTSAAQTAAALAALDTSLEGVSGTGVALRMLDDQVLKRAGETIERELADDPLVAGRLENVLGGTYLKLGLFDEAERHVKRSVEIRARTLGPIHRDTLSAMSRLGWIYHRQGRLEEAAEYQRDVLDTLRRVAGPEALETLRSINSLASVCRGLGRFEEAERLHTEGLEISRRTLGPEHDYTLRFMNNLGNVYLQAKRFADAEKVLRETLEIRRRVLPPDDRQTLGTAESLADVAEQLGRLEEAESMYRSVLEARLRVDGPTNPDTLDTMYTLGCFEARCGHRVRALDWLRQAVEHGYAGRVDPEQSLDTDECLASVRTDPAYQVILHKYNANKAARK